MGSSFTILYTRYQARLFILVHQSIYSAVAAAETDHFKLLSPRPPRYASSLFIHLSSSPPLRRPRFLVDKTSRAVMHILPASVFAFHLQYELLSKELSGHPANLCSRDNPCSSCCCCWKSTHIAILMYFATRNVRAVRRPTIHWCHTAILILSMRWNIKCRDSVPPPVPRLPDFLSPVQFGWMNLKYFDRCHPSCQ